MANEFYSVLDLEKLAVKLEELGFTREGGRGRERDLDDAERSRGRRDDRREDTRESRQDRRRDDRDDDRDDSKDRDRGRSQADSDPWDDATTTRPSRSRDDRDDRDRGRSDDRDRGRSSRGGAWDDIPRHGSEEVDTQQGTRLYEFGLDEAPDCNCGHPAARVSEPGKKWKQWRCALSYSRDGYKEKCKFQEWANKR